MNVFALIQLYASTQSVRYSTVTAVGVSSLSYIPEMDVVVESGLECERAQST